jgi:hypothetical protein
MILTAKPNKEELYDLVFNPEYVQQVGENTFIYTEAGRKRFRELFRLD